MAAVTFTQAEIAAFKAAMLANPGVLQMTLDGRSYTFETLQDKAEFLAYMQRNLDTGSTGKTRYGATSKGVQ